MILRLLGWGLAGLFGMSEIALAILKRAGAHAAQQEDRGSMRILWIAVAFGIGCAIASRWVPAADIRLPSDLIRGLAMVCLVSGLVIRWTSIVILGRHFTVDVAIRTDHALVQRGPYRLVRHPSYSGLLLAFIGLGLLYANWLSLLGLMVPITWAVMNRVSQEERALLAALGSVYADYCSRTKRFVPGMI